MASCTQLRFEQLNNEEKDVVFSFLDNLTEGDIRKICRDQMMDKNETQEFVRVWNKMIYEDWE